MVSFLGIQDFFGFLSAKKIDPQKLNEFENKLANASNAEKEQFANLAGKKSTLEFIKRDARNAYRDALDENRAVNLFNKIKNSRYSQQQAEEILAQLSLEKTHTTHPLNLASKKEQVLLKMYSQTYAELKDLQVQKMRVKHYGAQGNIEAIKASIAKLKKYMGVLETRFMDAEKFPLSAVKSPSPLEEGAERLPYVKRQIIAMAKAETEAYKAFVQVYDMKEAPSFFQKIGMGVRAWFARDNDRNANLLPEHGVQMVELERKTAFQLHAQEIQRTVQKLKAEGHTQLADELAAIRQRMLVSGHQAGFSGYQAITKKLLAEKVKGFASFDEYNAALQNVMAKTQFNTSEHYHLDTFKRIANNAKFQLVSGEGRHNAQDIQSVIAKAYDAFMHKQPNTNGGHIAWKDLREEEKLIFIKKRLNKKLIDEVVKSGSLSVDEQKLVNWAKTTIEMIRKDPKSMESFVIAECGGAADVQGLRKLFHVYRGKLPKEHIERFIALFENGADMEVYTSQLSAITKHANADGAVQNIGNLAKINKSSALKKLAQLFPAKIREMMIAASDTLRANGLYGGIDWIYKTIRHTRDTMETLGQPFKIYLGYGSDFMRTAGTYTFQMVQNMPDRIGKLVMTLQGDQGQRELRTQAMANYVERNGWLNHIARNFGIGNDEAIKYSQEGWAKGAEKARTLYEEGLKSGHVDALINRTPVTVVPTLKAGSRSGVNIMNVAGEVVIDWFKTVKQAASRAIGLSAGTKSVGLPYAVFGSGRALHEQILENGIDAFHSRYLGDGKNRRTLHALMEAAHNAKNLDVFETENAKALATDVKLKEAFQLFKQDIEHIKHWTPKIKYGAETTITFEQMAAKRCTPLIRNLMDIGQRLNIKSYPKLSNVVAEIKTGQAQNVAFVKTFVKFLASGLRLTGRFG